jgi:hypothetical protein
MKVFVIHARGGVLAAGGGSAVISLLDGSFKTAGGSSNPAELLFIENLRVSAEDEAGMERYIIHAWIHPGPITFRDHPDAIVPEYGI